MHIEAAGQRQPPTPWWKQLTGKAGTILSSWLVAAARWRRVRRAIQEVARLDDRMLKDIGIHRSEIERAVRCGRDPWRRSVTGLPLARQPETCRHHYARGNGRLYPTRVFAHEQCHAGIQPKLKGGDHEHVSRVPAPFR